MFWTWQLNQNRHPCFRTDNLIKTDFICWAKITWLFISSIKMGSYWIRFQYHLLICNRNFILIENHLLILKLVNNEFSTLSAHPPGHKIKIYVHWWIRHAFPLMAVTFFWLALCVDYVLIVTPHSASLPGKNPLLFFGVVRHS